MKDIFLVGAHTEGAPLPELVAEIRVLEAILRPLHERGVWGLVSNRAANLDDVFGAFSRLRARIAVFHYAGHASQRELHLDGGGQVRGIAELFGLTQGKTLQLVFLNGCATLGQVDSLHEAGVAAVVATNRSIDDALALDFARCFYETWAIEGKTLEQAFQTASALVHSKSGGERHDLKIETRSVGRAAAEKSDPSPWRLWLNPQLGEEARTALLQWSLHPPVALAPQVLEKVETSTSESLRKIAYEFCSADPDARKMVEQEGCSELLALLVRLPWTVGTHLRRLFAVDKGKTMAQSGTPRLREIVSGYTELTRFICYTALSALWDDSRTQRRPVALEIPLILPDASASIPPDYIFHLKQYHRILLDLPGDAIGLEAGISDFLSELDGRLQTAYQFMERGKDALAQTDKPALLANFIAQHGPQGGLDEVCRKAEAAFAQLIRAAFFLTLYTLYSVRAISVDKVRYLNLQDPYVHKTIALHAAFGEIKPLPTKRKIAGDNYSILLAPRVSADPLENALNLSPFYIDKHALIGEKRDNYPAIFVLKSQAERHQPETFSTEKVYAYEYLDLDVNHRYLAPEDHQLHITEYGLLLPAPAGEQAGAALKGEDHVRFREIYTQIEKFHQDFHAAV